jgi:hypothetical protein
MATRVEGGSHEPQIVLDLKTLKDGDGKPYYAAFPKDTEWLGLTLKLHECCFMIFTQEQGNETLIIKKFDENRKAR